MAIKKTTKKSVNKKGVSKKSVSKKKAVKKAASSPALLVNDPLAFMSADSKDQEAVAEDSAATETKPVSAEVEKPSVVIVEAVEEVSTSETPLEEVQVETMPEESIAEVTDELPTNDSDIVFTGPLTIATTEEWLSKIVEIVQTANEIQIDANEVSQIDGSGLQLICSLVKSAESKAIKIQWAGSNKTLKDAATQAGLDKAIGL